MNEQEALERMVAPGTRRPGKYREGVIQIWVTRACDKACYSCTQGSNLAGNPGFITPALFEQACLSLKDYFGVVGMFGGNPTMHPHFERLCEIMRDIIPFEQRGLWCNSLRGKGAAARKTFNPAVSNLNVHLDREAYDEFKRDWPEAHVFGLETDSRHSPPFVAMKDVLKRECGTCAGIGSLPDSLQRHDEQHFQYCPQCDGTGKVFDESRAWDLISNCDINQHWSAMIGVFRGELRAWFCEIAGAQAMLHQDEPGYPDTGERFTEYKCYLLPNNTGYGFSSKEIPEQAIEVEWWQLPMMAFSGQVRKHCFDCGVPLRGYGQLSQADDSSTVEQTSETHADIYRPKRRDRKVEIVTDLVQLGKPLTKMIDYLGNAKR